MYEPEVTVITPTHNIVEAGKADDFTLLLNLLNRQTYPYIEHIVMDNASTDETVELLKEYKNSGYISFTSAPDRGKYDAVNKALMKAKGKYIAILSCDDFYHDITGIADVVNVMEEAQADFCYFPAYCVPPDNNVFLYIPSIYNVFQVMPFGHQACLFSKDAIAALGGFDVKFKLFADYDLIIRLVLNNFKGVYFDGNIVTYKMAEQVEKYQQQVKAECSHIYHKNFRSLFPLNDNQIDRMVNIAEIPRPLLDRLVKCFPGDEEIFFERYEQMYNLRLQNAEALRAQERQQRR